MNTPDQSSASQPPQARETPTPSHPLPGLLQRRHSLALTIATGVFLTSLPSLLMGAGNPVPTSGTFYVAPTGSDTANGDITAPLASLGKAKELADNARKVLATRRGSFAVKLKPIIAFKYRSGPPQRWAFFVFFIPSGTEGSLRNSRNSIVTRGVEKTSIMQIHALVEA